MDSNFEYKMWDDTDDVHIFNFDNDLFVVEKKIIPISKSLLTSNRFDLDECKQVIEAGYVRYIYLANGCFV